MNARIIASLLSLVLLLSTALGARGGGTTNAATVFWDIGDLTGTPSPNRNVLITPTGASVSGTKIIQSDPKRYTTDSSGQFYTTNVAGVYDIEVMAPPRRTAFSITVPDTNGLINASDIITVSTNQSPVGQAYSMSSSDIRFLQRSNDWSWNHRFYGTLSITSIVGNVDATVENWADTAANIDTNTLPLGVLAWAHDWPGSWTRAAGAESWPSCPTGYRTSSIATCSTGPTGRSSWKWGRMERISMAIPIQLLPICG
jgi:hypothetical protein